MARALASLVGAFYLLTAAAASVASFVAGPAPAVGASGAVFGLFGILLAVSRTHHPVLDRRSQMIIGQIGALILINLAIGFGSQAAGGTIDNFAHIGGLLAGLWLGFLLAPNKVPTLEAVSTRLVQESQRTSQQIDAAQASADSAAIRE